MYLFMSTPGMIKIEEFHEVSVKKKKKKKKIGSLEISEL